MASLAARNAITRSSGAQRQWCEMPKSWAVDHLLLDHRGRPTFAEVKRSTNTRIRRGIVGPMLADAAPDERDVESFWDAVDENLQQGRVRLIFVADEIPAELRRVIEFRNEHMLHIEVLGVELRQYPAGARK